MKKKTPSKDQIHDILNEPWITPHKHETVKLPCGHGQCEFTKFGDQVVECPDCHKKWLLTNNQYGSKKLYSE